MKDVITGLSFQLQLLLIKQTPLYSFRIKYKHKVVPLIPIIIVGHH